MKLPRFSFSQLVVILFAALILSNRNLRLVSFCLVGLTANDFQAVVLSGRYHTT